MDTFPHFVRYNRLTPVLFILVEMYVFVNTQLVSVEKDSVDDDEVMDIF